LEQGPTEKTIIETCIRERRPLPDAIAKAPQLFMGLELYYVAYLDLSSCRSIGMAEGPIPWLAIYDYAQRLGMDEEQRDDLLFFVQSLALRPCKKDVEASRDGQSWRARAQG
jgi:hypothetical protein